MRKAIAIFVLTILITSCNNRKTAPSDQKIKEAIIETCAEFNISDYSYIITDQKNILEKKWAYSANLAQGKEIIRNFSSGLLLKQLIDNKIIDENETLQAYTSFVTDSLLKVKDLYKVPESLSILDSSTLEDHKSYIEYIYHKKTGRTLSEFEGKELKISNTEKWNSSTLLKAMTKISFYTNQKKITGYLPMGDSIPDLYPTWYTRNIRYFAGWHVFKINRHTIFWNFFSDKKQSFLFIKCIETGRFVGISTPINRIPNPSDFQHDDLLQSPLATAILMAMFLPENTPAINYKEKEIQIYRSLEKQRFSTCFPLYVKALSSRIIYYRRLKNYSQANKLCHVYNKLYPYALPKAYLEKPAIAEINYVSDRTDASRIFSLKKDTRIKILASGQYKLDLDPRNADKADNIEVMFSYTNKQKEIKEFLYRFIYGNKQVFCDNCPENLITFDIKDSNDSAYCLKAKIPWKVFGIRNPRKQNNIKFNICLHDYDLNSLLYESTLFWSAECMDNKQMEKKDGRLILSDNLLIGNDSITYSPRIFKPSRIGELWGRAHPQAIIKCTKGIITSKRDNSASFKTAWDKEFLYIQVKVVDNIKSKSGILYTDMCWIENAVSGELLWKQSNNTSVLLSPLFICNQEILLKAGTYKLRYQSDPTHSFENWLSSTPSIDNYGIRIYKNEK